MAVLSIEITERLILNIGLITLQRIQTREGADPGFGVLFAFLALKSTNEQVVVAIPLPRLALTCHTQRDQRNEKRLNRRLRP